jgi:glutamate--cysteine ligase
MARDVVDSQIVESRHDLVAWIEAGCKPPSAFRVGAEHEKFPFYKADLSPVPYEGPRGIGALMQGVRERLGWQPIEDGGALIGLADPAGGAAISLEPGGQFELSGAPLATIHEVAAELDAHLNCVHAVAEPLGVGFFALGLSPTWSLAETPVMPKSRYRIMTRYMPKVGTRGLDMMFRTCTVQANLDFSDEADMVAKLRVGLALQPTMVALFANSPFSEGRLTGRLSERSEIWRDTDPARTGMLPFVFEPGMGFERYVDYALDVPLYFVKRGGVYRDVAGASFRDLLAGRLAALPGERATVSDWANHLSTIFPEVRLKRYIEARGADVGTAESVPAYAALMVGLYYDSDALAAAGDLIRPWSAEQRQTMRDEVPRLGLAARVGGRRLREVARETLDIARAGLKRRARLGPDGADESAFLAPLDEIVAKGRVPAERWIARFEGPWGGRLEPIFAEAAM